MKDSRGVATLAQQPREAAVEPELSVPRCCSQTAYNPPQEATQCGVAEWWKAATSTVQSAMVVCHDRSGLPWWPVIMLAGVSIRCALAPLTFKAQSTIATMMHRDKAAQRHITHVLGASNISNVAAHMTCHRDRKGRVLALLGHRTGYLSRLWPVAPLLQVCCCCPHPPA